MPVRDVTSAADLATALAAAPAVRGRGRGTAFRCARPPTIAGASPLPPPFPPQAVAYFWAAWATPCKQMDAVVAELRGALAAYG